MSTLPDLILELEVAPKGSRELDKSIVLALYPGAIVDIYCQGDTEPVVFHASPLVADKHELPRFTSSLDSARTLTPEGKCWRVAYGKLLNKTSGAAEILEIGFGEQLAKAGAATAELALCAAALKALVS